MRHSVELDLSVRGSTDPRSPCGTQDLPLTSFHWPQASSHGRQVRLCMPARLLHASGHTLMLTWTCMLMLQLCFFHLVTMLWLTLSTMIYSDENLSHHCVDNSFMTLLHQWSHLTCQINSFPEHSHSLFHGGGTIFQNANQKSSLNLPEMPHIGNGEKGEFHCWLYGFLILLGCLCSR